MDIWSKLESDSNRYWFIGNDAFSSVFRLFRSLLIFEIIHRISCCFRTFDMESMAQFQWFHQDHFLESLIQSWRFKFEAKLAPDGGQVIIPKRTNQLRTNPVNFLVRFSSTVWRNLWMLFPTSSYNFFLERIQSWCDLKENVLILPFFLSLFLECIYSNLDRDRAPEKKRQLF